MAKVNADFDIYDDAIHSCETLLKSNFTKFHLYAKYQEELRSKLTATNEDYKILKIWLHIAYEDILASKSEHGDLVKNYETLSSSNFFEEFLEYSNGRDTLQFKFIKKMNECKDLMEKLNATNKIIISLKSGPNNDSTQRSEAALENHSVNEFPESTEQNKLRRSKFIEKLDECKYLKTYLDLAYEGILTLKSEFDEMRERYKVLLKNKNVERFLDCAKKLEVIGNKCKCLKTSLDRATHSNRVVEVDLSSNVEMDMFEAEVDMKEINLDPDCKREHQQSYLCENSENSTMLESKCPYEFDITEVNLDDQIKYELQQPYLSENSEDLAVVKQETPDHDSVNLTIPVADEFCASSNTHFQTDDSFEEKIIAMELIPEAVEHHDVFVQPEISTEPSMLQAGQNGSRKCQRKRNSSTGGSLSIKSLFHRRFECVTCGKFFPKKCILNGHMRVHEDMLFHCEKCGESIKTKNNRRKLLKCSFCGYVLNKKSNNHKDRKTLVRELFDPRYDICDRIYSSDRSLKEHISSVHDVQKSFKCTTCDKLFAKKDDLKKHALLHYPLSEKFFTRSVYKKSFHGANSRRRHEQTLHRGKGRFSCEHCSERFHQKRDILIHIQMQHLPKR